MHPTLHLVEEKSRGTVQGQEEHYLHFRRFVDITAATYKSYNSNTQNRNQV